MNCMLWSGKKLCDGPNTRPDMLPPCVVQNLKTPLFSYRMQESAKKPRRRTGG
jgi:hypothetical protein